MTDSKPAIPLTREHMPKDYRISLDSYVGRNGTGGGFTEQEKRIPGNLGPGQSLRGFEDTYRNIIDYIVRVTYKIWEERDIGYINDTYSNSSRVYDDYGLQSGSRKIISDTRHTTGAFPNIQLIADEIVWAGNDEVGFHTSHRTLIRGTNDGDSKYGPATNKAVDILVIANCVALDNEIFLEHVLYNNSALLLQLGLELDTMAKKMATSPPAGWPRDASTWSDLRNAARPGQPLSVSSPVSGFDVDAFARDNFDRLWNKRDYALLDEAYADDFRFHGPTNRTLKGVTSYAEFLRSLTAAFPDIHLQVDEVYWMGNDADGYLTSERWSAVATHGGDGLYGTATGGAVQIWGITQHRIVDGRIVNEWMLFNELDLLMQIMAMRNQRNGS